MNTEEIWNAYNKKLKHYIWKYVSNKYDGEDILQEVGIRLLKNEDKINEISNIEAWLYRITKNIIVDYHRRTNKYILIEDAHIIDASTSTVFGNENFNKETADCLLKLVEYLPPKYKEAIIESDYKGQKQSDLGNKWDLSYSGSKNRVQRARKKLKDTLLSCCEVKSDNTGNIIEFFNKDNKESNFFCLKC